MFHVIVLDDETQTGKDIIANVRDWGLVEPFVNLHAVQKIDQCLDLPTAEEWAGEWLFMLDCDLTDSQEGAYGGFAAWSKIVAAQPQHRPAYSIVYSQSITELIKAANVGRDRAAAEMRPRLFERMAKEASDHEPWWDSALAWIAKRQRALVAFADIDKRAEISAQLRQILTGSPLDAQRLFSSTLKIQTPGKETGEEWTISQLFPLHARAVWLAADGEKSVWQEKVLEVCYALLPQFPAVFHDLARIIFTNLRKSQERDEREFGALIGDTGYHAAVAAPDNKIYGKFCNEGWQWLQFKAKNLQRRLQNSHGLLSSELRAAIEADQMNSILQEMSEAADGEHILESVRQFNDLIAEAADPAWKNVLLDHRRDFVCLPLIPTVVEIIEQAINMQAVRHGGLAKAIPLKAVNIKNQTYCVFLTQKPGQGDVLEPEQMVEKCQAERENPQPTHLAGLVELVCGHYRGKLFVLQEPRAERSFNPRNTALFYAEGGRVRAESAATLPEGFPEILLLPIDASLAEIESESFQGEKRGRIENTKKGARRIRGTYYILVFPHW